MEISSILFNSIQSLILPLHSIFTESLATLTPPDRLVSPLLPLRVYIFLIEIQFII